MSNPICPYCGAASSLVSGDYIYPHRPDLAAKQFYFCANQHPAAYVGCHGTGKKPLGRLADAELRKMKKAAHGAFDPIWKTNRMKRKQAYRWLAEKLNIPPEQCHIGMFDVATCKRVVEICQAF